MTGSDDHPRDPELRDRVMARLTEEAMHSHDPWVSVVAEFARHGEQTFQHHARLAARIFLAARAASILLAGGRIRQRWHVRVASEVGVRRVVELGRSRRLRRGVEHPARITALVGHAGCAGHVHPASYCSLAR